MEDWRQTLREMDAATLETFGELVTIDGHSIRANIIDDSFDAQGFEVPVELRRFQIYISETDIAQYKLTRGMSIEYYDGKVGRQVNAKIGEFVRTSTTLFRVELA